MDFPRELRRGGHPQVPGTSLVVAEKGGANVPISHQLARDVESFAYVESSNPDSSTFPIMTSLHTRHRAPSHFSSPSPISFFGASSDQPGSTIEQLPREDLHFHACN